ncbi:LOW QUALITY PROTEIN: Fc receptor-like protein 4 [Cyanocitta cristata]
MPRPRPAVHPALALAGWCPLSPAGAQTTQLLVQPPWTPPVLWDRVTLTCQGSGTAGATTWYKDGQRWWLQGLDRFRVAKSGTYQCDRPGTGRSPPVSVSNDWLVLQVPARALMEGDTVTLRCRSWKDKPVTSVSFYHEEKQLQLLRDGTELSLSPLRLQDSGRYRCRGWVESSLPQGWKESESVTVTVHGEHPTAATLTPRHPHTSAPPQPLHSRLRRFYRDGRLVGGPQGSPQLLLPSMGVSHSGNYSCEVRSERGLCGRAAPGSASRCAYPGVPLSGVTVSARPPGGQVALGDHLVLSCTVATGTGPLSFSWHRGDSWALLGTGPRLELRHVGDNDSGHYQCRASNGDSVAESVPLNITILVPVANATISPAALAHPVRAGDPVTLRCSVQVGSAPVTFTWLHNGREVARGPLLELRDIHVGHSGTYQCVATNQLGQDGHRVFRAFSPELALTVTPRGHWDTVAVNIGRSLLFLVLLMGVVGGCHWWHRRATRKPQDRVPPEEGELLEPHGVGSERAGAPPRVSPGPAPPRHPQVTNAELPGPYEGQQDPGATYESVM